MKKIAKKIIDWLATTNALNAFWKISGKSIKYLINSMNGSVFFYNDPAKSKVMDLIKIIKKENKMILDNNEAYQLYMAVERTQKVVGEIAEVGSYMGGSAKLICEAKKDKKLYLFDTFEGLPDLTAKDNPKQFQKGSFISSYEFVKSYLKSYRNVFLYKGLFPITSGPIENTKFSFVHLDVDLYEATRESLEFFYPRMNRGGIIISHDYDSTGVGLAIDEFFKDKPEPVIEMSGCQCLIVKV